MKSQLFLVSSLLILLQINLFAQTDVSSNITNNTTWTLAGSPYNIKANIGLYEGATLTVEPGVTINYTGDYEILANGNVKFEGTESNPITFNGNNSTIYNVTSTFDLYSLKGKAMIHFYNNILTNSIIKYCKFNGTQYSVFVDNSSNSGTLNFSYNILDSTSILLNNSIILNIDSNKFTNSAIFGTHGTNPTASITNSSFENSDIEVWNSSNLKIKSVMFEYCNIEFEQCLINMDDVKILNSKGVRLTNDFGTKGTITNSILKNQIAITIRNYEISNCMFENLSNSNVVDCSWGQTNFTNCSIIGNGNNVGISSYLAYSVPVIIKNNTFSNLRIAFKPSGSDNTCQINYNNFLDVDTVIYNEGTANINAMNNFYETVNSTDIGKRIYDYYDVLSLGKVVYEPFSNEIFTDNPISTPQNITKVKENGGIRLTWAANKEYDLKGYKIYYNPQNALTFNSVKDVGNVNTYFIDGKNLTDTIVVTAYDNSADGVNDLIEGNESMYSSYITITCNINPINSGTIQGLGAYNLNSEATLTANPTIGYTFLKWTNGSTEISKENPFTFNVNNNFKLTANFKISQYLITANVNLETGGYISGLHPVYPWEEGNYNFGDEVSLSAVASPGYIFANWTEDGREVSTDPTYTFTATSNRDLEANFQISTGFKNLIENNTITVFPNPSNGNFAIRLDDNYNGLVTLQIHSIIGNQSKIIQLHKTTNNMICNVNMEDFAKGVYLIDIQIDNRKTIKMIVIN